VKSGRATRLDLAQLFQKAVDLAAQFVDEQVVVNLKRFMQSCHGRRQILAKVNFASIFRESPSGRDGSHGLHLFIG